MSNIKTAFKQGNDLGNDAWYMGENYESPNFQVSYNSTKSERGESTATIDFKIIYECIAPGKVSAQDMRNVRSAAYTMLQNDNKLSFYIGGENTESLVLKSISAKPIPGTDVWDVSAKYSTRNSGDQSQEPIIKNLTFSTQGKTSHITTSLSTLEAVPAAGFPGYDFQGHIGWMDGEFAGVDVKRPNLTFQRDVWILYNSLTWSRVRNIAAKTGSINMDTWYGFNPGNVLFTGVTQGQKATLKRGENYIQYWQINLSFEVANDDWIWFQGVPYYKRGWDYVWYTNMKTVYSSDTGKIVTRQPAQMNIEQVYPDICFGDFFGFGHTDSMNGEDETFFNEGSFIDG